ncbi:MAG: hypothetical protein ABIG44_17005 [Planctomycetota bacterium]
MASFAGERLNRVRDTISDSLISEVERDIARVCPPNRKTRDRKTSKTRDKTKQQNQQNQAKPGAKPGTVTYYSAKPGKTRDSHLLLGKTRKPGKPGTVTYYSAKPGKTRDGKTRDAKPAKPGTVTYYWSQFILFPPGWQAFAGTAYWQPKPAKPGKTRG